MEREKQAYLPAALLSFLDIANFGDYNSQRCYKQAYLKPALRPHVQWWKVPAYQTNYKRFHYPTSGTKLEVWVKVQVERARKLISLLTRLIQQSNGM
jgi:hypothetical protein